MWLPGRFPVLEPSGEPPSGGRGVPAGSGSPAGGLGTVPPSGVPGQVLQEVGSSYVGEVDILYETNAGYTNAIEAGRQPVYSPGGYYVEIEKDSLEAPKTVENTVYPILSWVWLVGMAAMLARTP